MFNSSTSKFSPFHLSPVDYPWTVYIHTYRKNYLYMEMCICKYATNVWRWIHKYPTDEWDHFVLNLLNPLALNRIASHCITMYHIVSIRIRYCVLCSVFCGLCAWVVCCELPVCILCVYVYIGLKMAQPGSIAAHEGFTTVKRSCNVKNVKSSFLSIWKRFLQGFFTLSSRFLWGFLKVSLGFHYVF